MKNIYLLKPVNRKSFVDITNQKFNKLTALEPCGSDKRGNMIWKCVCDCGNITYISTSKLKKNITKSCGCLKKDKSHLFDLTGQQFNNLKVIKYFGSKNCRRLWECECLLCGNKKIYCTESLTSRNVKSCGCLKFSKDYSRYKQYKDTKLFAVWTAMLLRCNKPSNKSYKNYGGRGIKVCKEWENDFLSFYNWALNNGYMDEPSENGINKWTIERINNDGNYEPSNCKWVTFEEQRNNRRITKKVIYKGKEFLFADLCKKYNLSYDKIFYRIFIANWDVERAIETN